jgi:sec-independent protein translocase protein TatA
MLGLRPVELGILLLIIILLFGARKLPETAKSIGESLKIFKKSVREDPPPAPPAQIEQRQVTGIPDKVPPTTRVDGNGSADH